MPAKIRKLSSGKRIVLKSIRLANGNLLVRVRSAADRTVPEWQEAAPGSSLFKRWAQVAVDEPDPRSAK